VDNQKIADRIAHDLVAGDDRAYKLLMGVDSLVKLLQKSVGKIESEANHLRGELVGLDKLGSGKMEAKKLLSKLLPLLEDLERHASGNIKLIKQAN